MKFPEIADRIIERGLSRAPDFIIGGHERPYLYRWWMIPRNRFFNAYLHLFMRDDDDRALHDHPWANASIILKNEYTEHRIEQGGVHTRTVRRAGDWHIRPSGKIAHRVELHNGPSWTLFLTGPAYRQWGFHCPDRGWVHWKEFVAEDIGAIGKGCNQ